MARTQHRTLRVGITGGIGSGKSTVCQIFERFGMPVLYADTIAKEISEQHPRVRRFLVSLLGASSFNADGTLNRQFIASRIFAEDRLRRRLNAMIHPLVRRKLREQSARYHRRGKRVVLVEAALLFESGTYKELDFMVLVDAPVELRIRRIQRRDNVSAAHVRRRMKAQWPTPKKRALADFVIRNTGSKQDVTRQVRFLHSLFMKLTRS